LSGEVAGVMEAITGAEHLSPACKQMLLAGCPGSLGEYADKRHAHQELVVHMTGEVLDVSRKGLETKLTEENAKISHLLEKKAELAAAVQDAEKSSEVKAERIEAVENELQALTGIMMSGRQSLGESKAAQLQGDKRSTELTAERSQLEEAAQRHLPAVQAGNIEATHGKALALLASELDESLRMALPKTIARPVEERRSFDSLVLQELEKMLQARAVKVDAELAAEKSGVDARAKVVADAEHMAEDSTAAERLKATELAAARAEHEQQMLAHSAAMEAEAVFERETRETIAARDAAKYKLDAFVGYTCECYSLLKDRVANIPETPATADCEVNVAPAFDAAEGSTTVAAEIPAEVIADLTSDVQANIQAGVQTSPASVADKLTTMNDIAVLQFPSALGA